MCNLVQVQLIELDDNYRWAAFTIDGQALGGRLWCAERGQVVDASLCDKAKELQQLVVAGLSARIAAARGPFYGPDENAYRSCMSILRDQIHKNSLLSAPA